MEKISLIVFARFPKLGKVKTRLASSTDEQLALDVYQTCLNNILYECARLNEVIDISIYCTDQIEQMNTLYGDTFSYKLQASGDLGEKMSRAFDSEFQSANKVLIIGTDIPSLNYKHLLSALDELKTNDTVIGETLDGGYYLLGLNSPLPKLFEDMPWSTSKVSKLTEQKILSSHKTLSYLEKLTDIDTAVDLKDWLASEESLQSEKLALGLQDLLATFENKKLTKET